MAQSPAILQPPLKVGLFAPGSSAGAAPDRRGLSWGLFGGNLMRVLFERSGGLAGIRLVAAFDSAALPTGPADELRRLVDGAGFFDLPPLLASKRSGFDRFRYKVTVETPERRHTVELDESAAPDSFRPLLDWLTAATLRRKS